MAECLHKMRSIDLTQDSGQPVWCLAPGQAYLTYLPQGGQGAFERNQVSVNAGREV